MNEDKQVVDVVEDDKKVAAEPEKTPEPHKEKKYTDADVDEIINKKFAKWKKEQEDEKSEADKMKRMSADEKALYEKQKQEKRIAELEAKLNRKELESTAAGILAEKGLGVSVSVLDFVVRDDAEQTLEAINAFSSLIDTLADQKVSEMLKGKTPTRTETASNAVTKEVFNKMSYGEQVAIFQDDPDLYAKLTE